MTGVFIIDEARSISPALLEALENATAVTDPIFLSIDPASADSISALVVISRGESILGLAVGELLSDRERLQHLSFKEEARRWRTAASRESSPPIQRAVLPTCGELVRAGLFRLPRSSTPPKFGTYQGAF